VNPTAPIVRAAHGPRGTAVAALASMLELDLPEAAAATTAPLKPLPFDELAQRQARTCTSPDWRAPPPRPLTRPRSLEGTSVVSLPQPPALDVAKFVAALSAAMPHKLLHVSGVLSTPSGGVAIDLSPAAARQPREVAAAHPGDLLCVSRGLSLRQIGQIALSCRDLPQRETLLTAATLPASELADLRTRLLHDVALPDGTFHDGSGYVSMDGERSTEHPQFATLLAEMLAAKNAQAAARNAGVEKELGRAAAQAEAYLRALDGAGAGGELHLD